MKKGLLLFFLFQIAVFNISGEEFLKTATIYTPDETFQIEYLYNAEQEVMVGYHKTVQDGGWKNVEFVAWTTDELGRKTVETTKVWKANGWVVSQETSFKYDGGKKTEELLQIANEYGELSNSTRTRWTETEVIVEKWENGWVQQSRSEYAYDGNGRLAQVTFRDSKNANIAYCKKFIYNDAGLIKEQILQTKIADSNPESFVNETRDTLIYDNTGGEILKISQKWNSADNKWRNVVRLESEYESGQLIARTLQNFGQAWNNATREEYEYESNRLVLKEYKSWIFSMWLDVFNENYTYNENGDTQTAGFNRLFWVLDFKQENKDKEIAAFLPLSYNNAPAVTAPAQTDLHSAHALKVSYALPEDLSIFKGDPGIPTMDTDNTAEIPVSVYPNPSKDGYFYFNSLEVDLLSYEVYDMFGRVIVARTRNDGYIDLSHVPSGMYNAVLHTNAGATVRKLIRQ